MFDAEKEQIQKRYFARRKRQGLHLFGAVAVGGIAILYLLLTY